MEKKTIVAIGIIMAFAVVIAFFAGVYFHERVLEAPSPQPPTPSPTPKTLIVTIRIESSTRWSGSIGFGLQSRTEEGIGNKEFSSSFLGSGKVVVAAVIQKQTDFGTLRVSIIADGETVATQSTTAAYGVVSVSWGTEL